MNFKTSAFRRYNLIRSTECLGTSLAYNFKEKTGETVLLAMHKNVDDVSEGVGEIKSKLSQYFYFNFLQEAQE